MHPHLNCPKCWTLDTTSPWATAHDAQLHELTLWLIDNAHARAWQDIATKLLAKYTITKKG